jgi:hypothetical protein
MEPPGLGALSAAEPAGEVVHERGRRVLHRRKIDVARRLAASALNLEPRKPQFTAWSIVGDGSIGSARAQQGIFAAPASYPDTGRGTLTLYRPRSNFAPFRLKGDAAVWSKWFWKIENSEGARSLIKTTSTIFLVLSAIQAAISIFLMIGAGQVAHSPASGDGPFDLLLTSILFAFFAFVLWQWNSRFAAVTLLILSVLVIIASISNQLGSTQGGPKIFLAIIAVWAGLRATEATFKLRGRFAHAGDPSCQSGSAPLPNRGRTSKAGAQLNSQGLDAERWNALLKYDPDIANAADQLRPFGDRWVDVFARDYLVLNDKQYLTQIIRKIIADAKHEESKFTKAETETHFEGNSLNAGFPNSSGGNGQANSFDREKQTGGVLFQFEPLKATGGQNYIARHWHGELSLPVSFWVNGLFANILASIVVIALSRGFDFKEAFDPGVALLTVALIWIITFGIALWQLVGNWRSATRYQQTKTFWGALRSLSSS